ARAELTQIFSDGWEGSLAAAAFSRKRFDTTQGADSYAGLFWRAEGEVRREGKSRRPRFGFTYSQETGNSNQLNDPGPIRSGGIYAQEEFSLGRWELVAGTRAETNNIYGSALTYRVGSGYWLQPETLALRAHYATGFKGPSLYQTYSAFGSADLNPERSRGAELSLAWQGENARAEAAIFYQGFRELVDFAPNPSPGRFYNLGRVATKGMELSGEHSFGPVLMQNAFTWLSAREAGGNPLLRRPEITNNLRFSYVGATWGGGLDLRFNGRRYDLNPVDYTRERLASFFVVGARASYRASSVWKITGRAENLLNRRYQETSGFGTPPLSFYLGAETEL
ncbi:MAG: TonB-dependent receptor, partial [Proteobacteria bacterium]